MIFQRGLRFQTGVSLLRVSCKRTLSFPRFIADLWCHHVNWFNVSNLFHLSLGVTSYKLTGLLVTNLQVLQIYYISKVLILKPALSHFSSSNSVMLLMATVSCVGKWSFLHLKIYASASYAFYLKWLSVWYIWQLVTIHRKKCHISVFQRRSHLEYVLKFTQC